MKARLPGEQGITLLELMMALAILAVMMLLTWSSTRSATDAKKAVEKSQARNHEIRLALSRMADDLSSAYLSANENQRRSVSHRRTLFLGKETSEAILRFSSLSHAVMWADANESEQTMIAYFTESDPEDSSKTNLLRRESRRLSDENWKQVPAQVDLLMRDIESVRFEYYDWKDEEWKDRWDSTATDGEKDRLPTRVRVVVEVPTRDREDTRTFRTQARLMLQEQFRFFAN